MQGTSVEEAEPMTSQDSSLLIMCHPKCVGKSRQVQGCLSHPAPQLASYHAPKQGRTVELECLFQSEGARTAKQLVLHDCTVAEHLL